MTAGQSHRRSAPFEAECQANGGLALALPPEALDVLAERVAELLAHRLAAPGPEPWVGVEEAARHLACKPKRIYDLVAQRRVAYRKDGTRLLFRRSDLDAYLDGDSA
jgi:excisionase family DNA binding protein